jgi:hypothetical protein
MKEPHSLRYNTSQVEKVDAPRTVCKSNLKSDNSALSSWSRLAHGRAWPPPSPLRLRANRARWGPGAAWAEEAYEANTDWLIIVIYPGSAHSFALAIIMFSLIHVVDVFMLLSFLIACRAFHAYRRRRGLPFPPGPPGWPVIGNLLDVPPKFTWLAYTEFSKKYGMAVFLPPVFPLKSGDRENGVLPCSWERHHRIEHR